MTKSRAGTAHTHKIHAVRTVDPEYGLRSECLHPLVKTLKTAFDPQDPNACKMCRATVLKRERERKTREALP